jgi:PGF-pre-PGF domain-containing protein
LGSNSGTSLTQTDSFTLDVVSPIFVITPTDNSWTSEVRGNGTAGIGEAFTFTYSSGLTTGNDTNTDGNVSCELWIVNASNGGVFLANGVNTTTLNGTETTIYNNQTLESGFAHNWTINCTYNGTDITQAVNDDYFILNVDNATPSVTVGSSVTGTTTATLTATTGSELTDCWCSTSSGVAREGEGSTQMGQTNTASHSIGIISRSAGTSYTYYVKCWDRADNPSSVGSTSFTTTAGTSGGGSGGSGGGISSAITGQSAQKTWASINAGETASVEVTNSEIGVTEVSFAVEETAWGAWLKVEKVDTLPSTVSSFPRKAYKNIKISENNVQKAMKDEATIRFKVPKSWLTENKIGQANVALYRFVGDKWFELSTSVLEDDGVYIHYSAETPGFSYFLIGMKDVTVGEETPEELGEVLEEVPEEAAEAGAEPSKTSVWMWLIPLIVALVVIVWLVWFKKKK